MGQLQHGGLQTASFVAQRFIAGFPGAFREAKKGQRVFFVEALAEDASEVGNVFVASVQEGKLGVVMSDAGHQEVAPNGDRFVVLDRGRRYEVEPGTPEFKVMEFQRYKVRIQDGEAKPAERSPNRLPINELILDDSNQARGELLWRIGLPVSALILALLAIPLSYVNPRAGRSANMLIAILIYAIYSNLMSVSQAWVAQGKLSFWIGVWAAHGFMLLPLALLFYRRIALRMPWQKGGVDVAPQVVRTVFDARVLRGNISRSGGISRPV